MTADAITRSLVNSLVSRGLLTGDVDELMSSAGPRGEDLVSLGLLSDSQRLEVLAGLLRLGYIELPEDYRIPPSMMELLSAERLQRYQAVPLGQDDHGGLNLAVAYPFDPELEDVFHQLTGLSVRINLCEARRIAEVLRFNQLGGHILNSVSATLKTGQPGEGGDTPALDLDDDNGDPVVRLVNQLCKDAVERRASDIHIHTERHGIDVKYRVDGVLLPSRVTVGHQHAAQLISRIKVMAGMDIAERQLPQDGRFRVRSGATGIDMRVSVLPTAPGEDAVIRLLDQRSLGDEATGLTIADLGLDNSVSGPLSEAIREPFGLVLVTGPTGSGKTTTLYAALNDANDGLAKIITIEDPVEYQLPGITQIAVNEKKGLTFANGLRSILRHDPDRVMVGEIRDTDTADIAVQAALTGHLVFSTVHANSAMDVIGRLTHMGVDRYSLVSALKGVLAQRLLRRSCSHCGQPRLLNELERTTFEREGLPVPERIVEAPGCDRCAHSGYSGRFAVAEFIYLDNTLRQLLVENAPVSSIEAVVRQQGIQTLRRLALKACAEGRTTLGEVNRVTRGWWTS